MPRERIRHRSQSFSRSRTPISPVYDHKRKRIDYDSPQKKGTYRYVAEHFFFYSSLI